MKNQNLINLADEYLVYRGEPLGKGATGEVFKGKSIKENIDVAVKVIDVRLIDNEVTKYLLEMEKMALMMVNSPFVLKGLSVIQDRSFCYLVSELCNGGTLKQQIRCKGPLQQMRAFKIFEELLRGECSLLSKGIIHRDLKPANILMQNGRAKIIDFGYCEVKGQKKPSLEYNVGSPSYMAPEAFHHNQYSQKSQVWALGVTFYECLNGKTFDEGRNMTDVYKAIAKNGIPFKGQVSEKSKKIIKWCLELEPRNRPSCADLLQELSSNNNFNRTIFASNITNIDAPVIQKRDIMKQRQPVTHTLLFQGLRKEQIVKFKDQTKKYQSRLHPVLSSREESKLTRPPIEPKPSVYFASLKNTQMGTIESKPTSFRHKSQLFNQENISFGFLGSRETSREHLGVKQLDKKQLKKFEAHERTGSARLNAEYYGNYTQRC